MLKIVWNLENARKFTIFIRVLEKSRKRTLELFGKFRIFLEFSKKITMKILGNFVIWKMQL